jgi:hypothetical protein
LEGWRRRIVSWRPDWDTQQDPVLKNKKQKQKKKKEKEQFRKVL